MSTLPSAAAGANSSSISATPEPPYYLELSSQPIRFDAVSQLTNVFFDDANRQVFAVRSGGATGIVVKGPRPESDSFSFCMDDKGPMRSIKFTADNRVLAVQRTDSEVEFIEFVPENNQPRQPIEALTYRGRNGPIHGFVWIGSREVAVISSGGIDLLAVNTDRKQIKSQKTLALSVEWFSWSSQCQLTVLSTNEGQILWPVLLKPGTITKLPKLVWKNARGVPERDLTLAQIYGISAILILRPSADRLMEVVVFLLNGPGLAPQMTHILKLGLSKRFAMNVVDDIVVVHHQASGTSMLFDIALAGQPDGSGCEVHEPLTEARSIRPMALPMPSLSFAGQTKSYSVSWVLFQPDIVIDAKLGCLWYVQLKLDPLCSLIGDRIRLVEFLLQRTEGRAVLMDLLRVWLTAFAADGDATMLTMLGTIFDRINEVYDRSSGNPSELAVATSSFRVALPQTCLSPRPNSIAASASPAARVRITQTELHNGILSELYDRPHIGTILLVYLGSLARLSIPLNDELGRMIVRDLLGNGRRATLRQLLVSGLLVESKLLACHLLSLSGGDREIQQMALDMLASMRDDNMIVEVLLGQGRVIDALRLAQLELVHGRSVGTQISGSGPSALDDPIVFHAVYVYCTERNARIRGSPEFVKSDMCGEYVEHYRQLFVDQ